MKALNEGAQWNLSTISGSKGVRILYETGRAFDEESRRLLFSAAHMGLQNDGFFVIIGSGSTESIRKSYGEKNLWERFY